EFTRIPVTIKLSANERPEGPRGAPVVGAVNGAKGRGVDAKDDEQSPLTHADFRVMHSSGQDFELCTDTEGQCSLVLFPGTFELRNEEGSSY
ncbi:unnamed protein product, partial [Polarella glacialis]